MDRKHGIDRGTEVTGGAGSGEGILVALGCPSSGIVTTYFQHIIVLPLTFGIWFGVFPFGTARGAYSTAVSHPTSCPDCGLSE